MGVFCTPIKASDADSAQENPRWRCGISQIILSPPLKKKLAFLFPELSDNHIDIVIMLASGVTIEDIAFVRNISDSTVRKYLKEAMVSFDLFSLQSLRSLVQVRLLLGIFDYASGA